MTEHYSGNDPGTGCAYIFLTAAFLWIIILVVVAVIVYGIL